MMNAISLWMVSSLISNIMTPGEATTNVIETSAGGIHQKLESLSAYLVGGGGQLAQLKMLCILLFASYVLKNIFFFINNVSLSFAQNRMITDIRDGLFSHIQRLPLSYFHKSKSGEIASITFNDVSNMRVAFTQSIQSLINEPISIFILLGMLFIISPKLTLLTLMIVPISAISITKLGQSIRRRSKRSSIQIAGIMNMLHESISGIRIVKAFTMENFEIERFKKENLKFFNLTFKQDNMRNLTSPINDLIGVSIGVLLIWMGGNEVIKYGNLSPEGFLRFIVFLFAMLQPARKLGNVNAQIQLGLASAERVFSIIDTPISIKDPISPKPFTSFTNLIQYQDVTFTYENSDRASLSNINLTINHGEVVALVGSSGAGKSTFVDLLPRFYDISSGSIVIDGIDIREITLSDLRSKMGIVTQETILFNDNIFNNIAYGMPNAILEDVVSAAKAANALEFIEELPEKFNTEIGEKGTRLSGGQRQRLSIARAILKNPEILILDEATSALDTESERKVQLAIDNLVKDRTVVVIAHRLSTIVKADRIIVFENGEIVESGNHQELLDKNGKYKKLYEIQFGDSSKK
jgi:ATP-binding cassette, subfamily B, bacterial MsbA